jgi:hypothetical protein
MSDSIFLKTIVTSSGLEFLTAIYLTQKSNKKKSRPREKAKVYFIPLQQKQKKVNSKMKYLFDHQSFNK